MSQWNASGTLDAKEIGSVWFRRPQWPSHFINAAPSDIQFLRDEWSKTQKNIYALADHLTSTLWINNPSAAYTAENKLVQLQIAQKNGLDLPDTLVSNNPSEIRKFITKHKNVIYKPFLLPAWEVESSGRMYTFWVKIIDNHMDIDDESLSLCPGIYQEYIGKSCDLRVTVIGDRFFTTKVLSSSGNALVDWRSNSIAEQINIEIYKLPIEVEERLKLLMRDLGVVFGCIDLVHGIDDKYYFLEINQGGQFLFKEKLVESLPLLQALSAMIAQGRCDYNLDIIKNVSYNKFIKSSFYHNWYKNVIGEVDTESLAYKAMQE